MVVLWQTRIPRRIYARLYCSWKRVKREVEILAGIFRKYNARRLIEFGCGLGRHGYLLSKMGFEVFLTDARDWRYGVARNLPFIEFDVLEDDNSVVGDFDCGYAVNFLIVFNYNDMVRALKNIGKVLGSGIFVADYNFTLYNEPRKVYVKVGKRVYRAVLEKEEVDPIEGGVYYKYRVKVYDDRGRLVGVEEDSYPVYSKEMVFRAIKEAGFGVLEVVWATWDPLEYVYKLSDEESDSAFIVMARKE